ncbi:MAG: TIGR01777 family oxidoreductase [Melioribacter sp.]|nr:TIGR01777 family oxidoreductase [Melioribacter sp.]
MDRKIIITGATGLIGRKITESLIEDKDDVIIFTRNPEKAKRIIKNVKDYVYWDYNDIDSWKKYLENSHTIIHLAGENIASKRWNKKFKEEIYNSRVLTTRAFVNALNDINNKPLNFLAASAVGFYGYSENEVDEYSEKGEGFLANLVYDWENESKKLINYGIRVVNIRLGTVLSIEGGALPKLILQFKFFLGGTLGNGNQWFPWIHINDAVGIFLYALNNPDINGTLNAVSPHKVRMKEFTKILGKNLNRPSYLKITPLILKIFFGEAAKYLLSSANVSPKRTQSLGYKFQYELLDDALINLLKS